SEATSTPSTVTAESCSLSVSSYLLVSFFHLIKLQNQMHSGHYYTGVISVQSATYGRTSSQICSAGRPRSQISNTWCSKNVPVIFKRCNGLRTCEFKAQGLARPDPCFGTYKYYTTNYICITAETSVTCDRGYGYLKCEHGKIQINTANYGRTDKTTCSQGRPSQQLQNTNCFSPNALDFVSKRCEGKSSCSILASNSVFSDPCFGTFKYLNISYSCVSKCKCYCIEKLYCIVFLCVD
uniref:SUEL-type lectin domain-containing protein n=1 Tax=Cyprinus carpio TaxID=7962 RepID=A0A8C1P5D4_CYPCA